MARVLRNMVLVIVAVVVISAVSMAAMGLLELLLALLVVAIKIAFFVGVIYLIWVVIRRFTQTI